MFHTGWMEHGTQSSYLTPGSLKGVYVCVCVCVRERERGVKERGRDMDRARQRFSVFLLMRPKYA